MTRLIHIATLIILQTAITAFAQAQHSASAVMNVSVRVIRAPQVTLQHPTQAPAGDSSQSLTRQNSVLRVENMENGSGEIFLPENISLQSEKGQRLEIPVQAIKVSGNDGEKMAYSLHMSKGNDHDQADKSSFNGKYTAEIQFF